MKDIPDKWSAQWFRSFITSYLQNADTRNATAGAGITITGAIGKPATIASSAVQGSPYSVFGNPSSATAANASIQATAAGQLLTFTGSALAFATVLLANDAGLGPSFTVSGLTAGQVLQATMDGNTAAFSAVVFPQTASLGDVVIGTAANTLGSLPIGSNGNIMGVAAGLPAWLNATSLTWTWGQITGTPTTLAGYGITPATSGWGTPTGGSVQNNFSASAATLPQTAAAVAELIANLTSLGLIGA